MKQMVLSMFLLLISVAASGSEPAAVKPGPEESLQALKDGNVRFVEGKLKYTHVNKERVELAGKSDQGNFAYATIISCSDSRVPVEYIFDAGVMDVFVVRVAGNVCRGDEIGSIEYGVCHVNTPVLLVLGHTQCGAVKAVAGAAMGHGHALERNIPDLVSPILPVVDGVRKAFPEITLENLIVRSIEQNVWRGMENIFLASPALRERVKEKKLKMVGGIYDVGAGTVNWLPEGRVGEILEAVEKNPQRALEAMAGGGHEATPAAHSASGEAKAEHAPAVESKPAHH